MLPVIEAVKPGLMRPSPGYLQSAVAEAGIRSGADLINDIWGLKGDAITARVIARYDVPCCLMATGRTRTTGC